MLSGMNLVPGVGVDWDAVARVGLLAIGLAVVGAIVAFAIHQISRLKSGH